MNDGSDSVKNSTLKNEWSILVQSFIEDDLSLEDPMARSQRMIHRLKSEGLTFQDLKAYAKHLSHERKSVNNQIEEIKQAIEEKHQTIENLILVKSDTAEVLKEIEELNGLGQQLSQQMEQINRKVKSLRMVESLFSEAS